MLTFCVGTKKTSSNDKEKQRNLFKLKFASLKQYVYNNNEIYNRKMQQKHEEHNFLITINFHYFKSSFESS